MFVAFIGNNRHHSFQNSNGCEEVCFRGFQRRGTFSRISLKEYAKEVLNFPQFFSISDIRPFSFQIMVKTLSQCAQLKLLPCEYLYKEDLSKIKILPVRNSYAITAYDQILLAAAPSVETMLSCPVASISGAVNRVISVFDDLDVILFPASLIKIFHE